MSRKILCWTIVVSLGGLLFGLDCAVISGAEQAIQKLWNLSNAMHGFAISSFLIGTIIGAAAGNIPSNIWGRKPTLIIIGILFFISSLGSALASHVTVFILYRIIGGLSIGASSVVAPVYIAEIAPAPKRGQMVMFFQLSIVSGILLAYFTNYELNKLFPATEAWRWMLGIVAFPALVFIFGLFFIPESPRWLIIYKNNILKAQHILKQINENFLEEVNLIKNSASAAQIKTAFFQRKYMYPILLSFLIAFFNQLSGINAVIYYAPRIFEYAHFGKDSALFISVGIGVVNILSTILGWYLIDRFGRKFLMYLGSIGYIISLIAITFCFIYESYNFVPYLIYLFILSHAVGQGSVIWVFISEIFPNAVRAQGSSWGCMIHWVFDTLITFSFPILAVQFGPAVIFGFFAVMMVGQLIFVWKLMPETKGVSLEDLSRN